MFIWGSNQTEILTPYIDNSNRKSNVKLSVYAHKLQIIKKMPISILRSFLYDEVAYFNHFFAAKTEHKHTDKL